MPEPARTSPVTLAEVARAAGVSLATASRVLNGSERKVNDSLREHVTQVADRLGYTPNLLAQTIARGSSMAVALIVSDIADPYFSSIAAGVIAAASDAGLIVTMSVSRRSGPRELELVRALRGQRPRVMILAGSRIAGRETQSALAAELRAFEDTGGLVVLISQHEMPFATVLFDNRAGAHALAQNLVSHGYRRFAVFTGAASLLTSRDRLAGFAEGLGARGVVLDDGNVIETEFTHEGGYRAATELMSRGLEDIDLVFAVNDVMAIGAMAAFRDRGVAIPTGIAVAGFDDIPTARDVTPALTTVHLPLEEAGRRAVELALAARPHADDVITIDGTVVLRESTPPRQ